MTHTGPMDLPLALKGGFCPPLPARDCVGGPQAHTPRPSHLTPQTRGSLQPGGGAGVFPVAQGQEGTATLAHAHPLTAMPSWAAHCQPVHSHPHLGQT